MLDLSPSKTALIGMVHLPALPGTPAAKLSPSEIVAHAENEALALAGLGFHALLIENMHDRPYQRGSVPPEITATMTAAARAVRQATGLPTGIQVLAAANREALAIALAAELDFIRAEGFVFAHVADEGIIESCAADLLRYRRTIGAEHVQIFADIKKKHSAHAITADVSIEETAHAAEFFCADGLIVTGTATGQPADAEEVARVRKSTDLPILVGSGITPENIAAYAPHAHALIVGSSIKKDGYWGNPIDEASTAALFAAAANL